MAEIHLRECSSITSSPRRKPPPNSAKIPVPFSYTASDDGTDENLLVLLHGLGDTHTPFTKLGRSLNLPQTATLALRAPEQIPFLYEQAYQWYASFDPLGDLIERPNPTPALDLLRIVFAHLIDDCNWPSHCIHLFGFAQGGSVAVESTISWWKGELAVTSKSRVTESREDDGDRGRTTRQLGSVVTVCGPLLSYPTLEKPCPTPLLVFHRGSLPKTALTSFYKAFTQVQEVKGKDNGQDESMPRSKDEWEPIMRFWSEVLGRRTGEGLYEVMSGAKTR
ncbi:hypothetical protein M404DRAFT_1002201 [Pisolithus tinctorius Marx 270]|uniref:Phospholipase/carboxylesterase/thioesterase domain-containing protein n=1 Tax=Pisolithus tinctorius Marx 270 TaxID=870435 RepID=A0A0C3J0H1_PISTI|nr:hypothetical protein M404DRAFT_1002201 [Pisolithus tinctorius Marx 270]